METRCYGIIRPVAESRAPSAAKWGCRCEWRTSLDSQAWRQLLEKCRDVASLQLTAYDHPTGCINAVHLKDRYLGAVCEPKVGRSDRAHVVS